jgi:hypothetical protein
VLICDPPAIPSFAPFGVLPVALSLPLCWLFAEAVEALASLQEGSWPEHEVGRIYSLDGSESIEVRHPKLMYSLLSSILAGPCFHFLVKTGRIQW